MAKHRNPRLPAPENHDIWFNVLIVVLSGAVGLFMWLWTESLKARP